ncbi:MAG TPA: Rieske 2Fe-2S domain-containing protein [Pirellulales bacterium]|nr:Rieske 2Fe-2S domain-containing protein [Pirellulales bacterium]
MAEKKKMTVAEILAAARKADSKQGEAAESAPASEAPTSEPEPEIAASAEAPAESPSAATPAKPVATPGAAGRPSVSDILAAARAKPAAPPAAKKPAAAAPKPAAAGPKPAEKPAAKATPKPAEKEKPAPVLTAEKNTASILAAAHSEPKPGPMTKAAAAKLKPEGAPAKSRLVVPPMPPKPEYAKPKPGKEAAVEDRRGFLSMMFGSFMAIGFTSMSVTFGLWTLGTARFMFPNVLTEPPSRFKVGFKSDFPPGSVEEKFKAQFGVWIVNTEYQGKREIFALRTVCTHLGCTPNWLEGEQKFKCPCHGSGFYKDGINFEGPAPRPLERYSIQLADDGQLEVDKSKLFQEELGQWNDPTSFVAV